MKKLKLSIVLSCLAFVCLLLTELFTCNYYVRGLWVTEETLRCVYDNSYYVEIDGEPCHMTFNENVIWAYVISHEADVMLHTYWDCEGIKEIDNVSCTPLDNIKEALMGNPVSKTKALCFSTGADKYYVYLNYKLGSNSYGAVLEKRDSKGATVDKWAFDKTCENIMDASDFDSTSLTEIIESYLEEYPDVLDGSINPRTLRKIFKHSYIFLICLIASFSTLYIRAYKEQCRIDLMNKHKLERYEKKLARKERAKQNKE